jgi:hypothetical protein
MKPHSNTLLVVENGTSNSLFNKCCWENCINACRKLKLDPCLSLCANINSRGTKDLNIDPKL